jgi:hypothetical protein
MVCNVVHMKLIWLITSSFVFGSATFAKTLVVSLEPLSSIQADRQFRTIQEAAKSAEAGDNVAIHSGVYRETVTIEKSGTRAKPIRFEAAPAANVVVTGLDILADWRKENGAANVFSAAWPHRFIPSSKTDAYPEDEYHRLIGRTEQVLVNGYPLHQTLDGNQLSRGEFYVDFANKRLFICPPNGLDANEKNVQVEAATRSLVWDCKGDYVTVHGIHFRNAANPAQKDSVIFQGRGDTAEDCKFGRMNASGAVFAGSDQIVRRCTFEDNGQLGFAVNHASSLLITGCTIRNNNIKGFNKQWEAGGNKFVLSRGVVVEKSRFLANHGCGLWFDIGNENCTVRNCLIADNEDAGIFYEISYGLHAHDNVITGNGFAYSPDAWGGQAGIVLSSSPNCVVERNLLVGNREGFNFREQARITARIDNPDEHAQQEVWNHDEQIRNNIIAYNRDAQTRGWFGVSDQRHWPRKMQEANPDHAAAPIEGICLENLHFDLSHNVYAREDHQPLFIWGTSWLRHVDYTNIAAINLDLRLEIGSRIVPLAFKNFAEHDFRLPRNSEVFKMKCYPRGEVPEVKLGALR